MGAELPFCPIIGGPCINPMATGPNLHPFRGNLTKSQLKEIVGSNGQNLVLVPGCGTCRAPDQQVGLANLSLVRTITTVDPQAAMFSTQPEETPILGVRGGKFYALPAAKTQDLEIINALQQHGHDVKIMPGIRL